MSKKFVFILALSALSVVMGSCAKSTVNDNSNNCVPNNTGVPTSAEIASLQAYLTAHSITATQDPRGFFYAIYAPGTGATPTLSNTVKVKYTGTLESGAIFDQNLTGASFLLSDLILGWQMGIPLIKKGGTIQLYLPPSLAYRCNAIGTVPAGANLIFNIELIDVL